jgi:DNA polymerase III delta subunit
MRIIHKDKPYRVCFDHETFLSEMNRGSLFGTEPMLLIMRGLTDDAVRAIAPLLDYETEDIIALIEQSTLKRVKPYQKIKSECAFLKLEPLPARACKKWLTDYMASEGVRYTTDIPGYLIERRGTDLPTLAHEVKKLKLLSAGENVTEAMCATVVSVNPDANNYEFVDSFIHKRTKKMLKEMKKIEESQLIPLLHFLLNYLERLYKISIYRSQKRNAGDIADLIGIPKFIIQTKYLTALSVFPKGKILKLFDILNDLDFQLRLSKWNRKMLFEFYMLKAMNI